MGWDVVEMVMEVRACVSVPINYGSLEELKRKVALHFGCHMSGSGGATRATAATGGSNSNLKGEKDDGDNDEREQEEKCQGNEDLQSAAITAQLKR